LKPMRIHKLVPVVGPVILFYPLYSPLIQILPKFFQVDNLLFSPTDCNFNPNSPPLTAATRTLDYHNARLDPSNLFTIDSTWRAQKTAGSAVYHTNPLLKSILTSAVQSPPQLRMASLGGQLMAVERLGGSEGYRLCQTGLHHVAEQLIARRVPLSVKDLQHLLQQPLDSWLLSFDRLSSPAAQALRALSHGPCVLYCKVYESCTLTLAAFSSGQKVGIMIKESARKYYLFLLGEEESSL
jgi:hypothetical protein